METLMILIVITNKYVDFVMSQQKNLWWVSLVWQEPLVNPIIPPFLFSLFCCLHLNVHCMYEVSNVHLFCALMCSREFEICPFPSNLKRATNKLTKSRGPNTIINTHLNITSFCSPIFFLIPPSVYVHNWGSARGRCWWTSSNWSLPFKTEFVLVENYLE